MGDIGMNNCKPRMTRVAQHLITAAIFNQYYEHSKQLCKVHEEIARMRSLAHVTLDYRAFRAFHQHRNAS